MTMSNSVDYQSCLVCCADLDKPFVLERMPGSAQGFDVKADLAAANKLNMHIYCCKNCGLVQYKGPSVPYYKNTIRSTKLSPSMLKFRKDQFSNLLGTKRVTNVFELGAGAGEYLDIFKSLGVDTCGIEGSDTLAGLACGSGHDVVQGYLPLDDFGQKFGVESFDLITSFNFIEHLPDPLKTLRQSLTLLKPDGLALLEVPNFDMIDQFGLFNEFIPDHVSYFNQSTFITMLSLAGLDIVSVGNIWDDYIISVVARKKSGVNWEKYDVVQSELKISCENFFSSTSRNQNAIWSAGHQSLATISNLQLENVVSCIIDSAPSKQNKYAPGSGLPVVSPEILARGEIKTILLAAAGFNQEISETIKSSYPDHVKIGYLRKGGLYVE